MNDFLRLAAVTPVHAPARAFAKPVTETWRNKTIFSVDLNALMARVKSTVGAIRAARDPLTGDQGVTLAKRALIVRARESLEALCRGRDAWLAHIIGAVCGKFQFAAVGAGGPSDNFIKQGVNDHGMAY